MDKKKKTIFYLVFLVFFMGSASFLSVPFYNWFCKVTGYGGTTSYAQKESEIISDRVISIRFDASLEKGIAWEVKPIQREMTINLGFLCQMADPCIAPKKKRADFIFQ